MIITLLCVAFSSLTFKGLTLTALMAWFNSHPFWFILAVWELIHGLGKISIKCR